MVCRLRVPSVQPSAGYIQILDSANQTAGVFPGAVRRRPQADAHGENERLADVENFVHLPDCDFGFDE